MFREEEFAVNRLGVKTVNDLCDTGGLQVSYVNSKLVAEYSKFVRGKAAGAMDEITCARALLIYISLFGLFDEIWSDPGSDFTSKVIAQLTKYLGINHVFSLVDRHESCGVEGSDKQMLRHVKPLVTDEL